MCPPNQSDSSPLPLLFSNNAHYCFSFMSVRKVAVNNPRLVQGQTLLFRILKLVELNPNDSYWVLQDPMGYKLLLPAVFYANYGLEEGNTISCRIDKINCNGKVFLEPQHPVYQEGKAYDFPVVEYGERLNILDESEFFIRVRASTGDLWDVVTHNKVFDTIPAIVSCFVERIKKGKLFLRLQGDYFHHSSIIPGNWYSFRIIDEKVNPADKSLYYILEGPGSGKHLLKKKYYRNYKLMKDMGILCRVEEFSTNGFFLLEPLHPCYNEGEVYSFNFSHIEEQVFSDGGSQKVLVLNDCFKEEIKILINEESLFLTQGKKQVMAKVVGVRKSRPEVELLHAEEGNRTEQ